MVGVIAKTNVNQFVFALRAYKAATRKDEADILNRAARNVAYRASQFTPRGNAARIRAGLMRDPHLRYALTAMALKRRGVGALKSPGFAKEVARFVSRRASSAGYLRAAYAEAIQQLGGTFRGAKFKGASGFANKASIGRLLAQIVAIVSQPTERQVRGAEEIGLKALNQAVKFVAEDMLAYSQQKLAQTARAHSG